MDSVMMDESVLGSTNVATVRYELRRATVDLSGRGLKLASKWAAEQLNGLPEGLSSTAEVAAASQYPALDTSHDHKETEPSDELLFAKALLDAALGESSIALHMQRARTAASNTAICVVVLLLHAQLLAATRAAAVFMRDARVTRALPARSQFVRHYSLYLAGEKRKAEETAKLSGPLERCSVTNPNLLMLHEQYWRVDTAPCLLCMQSAATAVTATTAATALLRMNVAVRNGGCSSLYCFGRHSGQCDAAVAYDYPAQHTQANGSSSTAALYRSLSSQVTTLHQHCGQADSTAWELDTLQVAAPYMHNLESVTDTAYKRADVDSSGYSVRSLSIQLDTAA
eukprot:13767-Heterococcus_DN1.PRE.3